MKYIQLQSNSCRSYIKARGGNFLELLEKTQRNSKLWADRQRIRFWEYILCRSWCKLCFTFLKGACVLFESCELLLRSDLNYSLWFSSFFWLVCFFSLWVTSSVFKLLWKKFCFWNRSVFLTWSCCWSKRNCQRFKRHHSGAQKVHAAF